MHRKHRRPDPGLLTLVAAASPWRRRIRPRSNQRWNWSRCDVQVVDKDGKPIAGMKPEDFEVTIEGRKRTVVSAQLIQFQSAAQAAAGPSATPDAAASPSGAPQRRIVRDRC